MNMADFSEDNNDPISLDPSLLHKKLTWACELVREASRENRSLKEELE